MTSPYFPADGPHASFRAPWLPNPVRWVLLTEAPPAYETGRYFYRPFVPKGDSLFLEVIKMLFADEVATFPTVKALRREKPYFLGRLKDSGFLLTHGTEAPLPTYTTPQRERLYETALPDLMASLIGLGVGPKTPIVIVSAVVHKAVAEPLAASGFSVLNRDQAIPYPNSGQQANTRRLLVPLLRRHGLVPQGLWA